MQAAAGYSSRDRAYPTWFRVQAHSWFRMQGHSWFQVQGQVLTPFTRVVVSDAALSCFRVQTASWFQVQGRSWFRMQLMLGGLAVVTGAAPSVVSDAAHSCLRMQKHVVSKAPQNSNRLFYKRNSTRFPRLTS